MSLRSTGLKLSFKTSYYIKFISVQARQGVGLISGELICLRIDGLKLQRGVGGGGGKAAIYAIGVAPVTVERERDWVGVGSNCTMGLSWDAIASFIGSCKVGRGLGQCILPKVT